MSNKLLPSERPDPPAEIRESMFKLAVASLPVLGPALSELLFDCRSRIKQERVVFALREAIHDLDEAKIDREFLKSAEGGDFLEDILLKVAVNRSELKKEYFKKLLIHAFQGQRPPDLSPLFLSLLNVMTDEEIKLFAYLCRVHHGMEPYSVNGQEARWYFSEERIRGFGLELTQFKVLALALSVNGLITMDTQDGSFEQFAAMNWSYSRITPMGIQFNDYLVAG